MLLTGFPMTLWNTLVHGSFLLMPLLVVIFYRRIIQVTSTFAALLAIALIMSIGRADLWSPSGKLVTTPLICRRARLP